MKRSDLTARLPHQGLSHNARRMHALSRSTACLSRDPETHPHPRSVAKLRLARIVTAHSGRGQKSVSFEQNPRSTCSGIVGQVQSESAVNLDRNSHRGAVKKPHNFDLRRALDVGDFVHIYFRTRRFLGLLRVNFFGAARRSPIALVLV